MKNGITLITAHSGADGTCENSMEFVYYALTTSADVLELDVRRTRTITWLLLMMRLTAGQSVSGMFLWL